MNTKQTEIQRPACLIIEAAPWFGKEANALVRRAAAKVGLKGVLMGRSEAKSYGMSGSRFLVDCTDWQFSELMKTGAEIAKLEGWERFPVDAYHD